MTTGAVGGLLTCAAALILSKEKHSKIGKVAESPASFFFYLQRCLSAQSFKAAFGDCTVPYHTSSDQ